MAEESYGLDLGHDAQHVTVEQWILFVSNLVW